MRSIRESKKDIVILNAIKGYGKTTLVEQLIKNRKTFFLNSEKIKKELKNELNENTNTNILMKKTFNKGICAAKNISNELKNYEIVVIEDINLIQDKDIRFCLKKIIELKNSNVLFIITSMYFPKILSRYIIEDKIMIVDKEKLKFNRAEIKLYLEDSNRKITNKEINDLYNYTKGWQIAVKYFKNEILKNENIIEIKNLFAGTQVYDWIDSMIFQELSYELQNLMINSAYLGYISQSLCNKIIGEEGYKIFGEIIRNKLFIEDKINSENIRFIKIFRDFLMYKYYEKSKTIFESKKSKELLYVQCFGDFEVKVLEKDEILKFRTSKARELFAYLYLKKGEGVTKQELCNKIYPDINCDKLNNIFHTNFSYLRMILKKVGYERILKVENRKYYFDSKMLRGDIEEFNTFFEKIVNNNIKAINRKKLLEFYGNGFMNNIYSEWNEEIRRNIEKKYLMILRIISENYIQKKDFNSSIEVLKKIVEINPYSEDDIILLLFCMGKNKDTKNLRLEYLKFEEIFKKDLGIKLNKNIVNIYKKSISGEYS